jgi:hypothetical protein
MHQENSARKRKLRIGPQSSVPGDTELELFGCMRAVRAAVKPLRIAMFTRPRLIYSRAGRRSPRALVRS